MVTRFVVHKQRQLFLSFLWNDKEKHRQGKKREDLGGGILSVNMDEFVYLSALPLSLFLSLTMLRGLKSPTNLKCVCISVCAEKQPKH